MKSPQIIYACLISLILGACSNQNEETTQTETTELKLLVDQFADLRLIRYEIPGFENLTLKEKQLVYYLNQAGLAGRDIIWDQNYRHNMSIREALEQINTSYAGDRKSDSFAAFKVYLKRVWFSNGIHHHYSNDKIKPSFTQTYFVDELLKKSNTKLDQEIINIIFNDLDAKKVNKKGGIDNILSSAVNFYGPDITDQEVIDFYKNAYNGPKGKPIEAGLNSKLIRENGVLVEKVWRSGGMYGAAIDQIIGWLNKAVQVAENKNQEEALKLLITYYKTGSLDIWDQYCIAWATSTQGNIDWINGFIEVYNDPKGYRGSYESIVEIKDFDMSQKMAVLSQHAQWFEDHSPLLEEHKKKNVVGITYKTVHVAGLGGAVSPNSPIGVNLPNNNWIRKEHGSKSVSLGNITDAYNSGGSSGRLEEFAFDQEEIDGERAYGEVGDKLHTALHEVVGHASGQLNEGVGQPKETLQNYYSTIEEGRADLVGLYYAFDAKIQELGLTDDWQALGKATYDGYIRNGLITQLIRIELGNDIEEAHMVNRQWVAAWAYEQGAKNNVIERIIKDNKTYYDIKDYQALREIFGQLLQEVQRIKSEGDFEAAKALVEGYGVKVDQKIHAEILARDAQFTSAPYGGFVNPVLNPIMNTSGEITNVEILQPKDFEEQMLFYSKHYHFLNVED